MGGRAWSADDLKTLSDMYLSGSPEHEIAEALGRTVASIAIARYSRRILRPADKILGAVPWGDDLKLAARLLFEAGLACQLIADRFGRSRIAIKRMANMEGWKRSPVCTLPVDFFDTELEQWKILDHIPYAVSNLGRVLSRHPGHAGKILKAWRDDHGYDHVTLEFDDTRKRHAVHRLVASAFLGPRPVECKDVAHEDGVPWNNNKENLRWSTHSDNQRDRARHGTVRMAGNKHLKVWLGPRKDDIRISCNG